MIFHINLATYKAGVSEEQREAGLELMRQVGANPVVKSWVVGPELGGEFEFGAVYVVEDLDSYWAYLEFPAHVHLELWGIPYLEKFAAIDVCDSEDPELGAKIAALQARNYQEHPEIAAEIAQAASFTVPGGAGQPKAPEAAGGLDMWRHNVDLLAYHDLDGRSGLKLALQEAGGRFFLYVAGFWHSGWSILEVTDPEHPQLLRWLPGPPNTFTIQVQVADGTMITALEHPPPGLTLGDPHAQPKDGFLIWDVHEPDRPQLLGTWVSGGTGTHRNFYNGGPWVYATSNLPGFEGQILAIVDIADPANPKTAGTWWHPGQHKAGGETYTPEDQRKLSAGRPYPQHGLSLHGGAYALGDRAYCPWMRGGMVILDITDKHHPAHVATLPVYPPLGSTIAVHSAVPLPGRDIVVINSEALRENCDEPAGYVATVDISDESDPILMAVFPPPRPPAGYDAPSFCAKGGRAGPHNQHQQQGLDCLAPNDRLVYLAYFNAGLQIYDITDPRDPHITGYYIPDDPTQRRGPIPSKLVHQAEDVLVDRRGVIYMSEGNSGIYILTHNPS